MAISFNKYVNITSGVGAGASVKVKELILRIFTKNELVPTDTVVTMTEPEDVGAYFGTNSEEYKRANFYFGFISKGIKRPKKISFYRYVDADSKPLIFGGTSEKAYTSFSSISDGTLDLTIGGVTNTITTDFTTATSLADIASLLQTEVQKETEAQFATATITYDTERKSFNFTGGVAEDATISATEATTGTSILNLLEWGAVAIFSDGKTEQTLTETLDKSADLSTNFATFLFIDTLSIADKLEIGKWTKVKNVAFLFLTPTDFNNAQTHYDTLKNYGGVDVILKDDTIVDEYPEMMASCIAAATDYNKVNSVQNYMYYQFALTPTVTETQKSNLLDGYRVNYYGQTQKDGQKISFYQRGNLMGLATDPIAENIFINEVWFKSSCGAAIMELLLNLQYVGWNKAGRGRILNTLQSVINKAKRNGVISVDKPINNTQKLYIEQVTNDENAWHEVQDKGFWIDCELITETQENGTVEYIADYTIIYAKADAIRKVVGTHTLI